MDGTPSNRGDELIASMKEAMVIVNSDAEPHHKHIDGQLYPHCAGTSRAVH